MRNLKKQHVHAPIVIAAAFLLFSCVDAAAPVDAPNLLFSGGGVASVTVTVAQPTLTLGQTTQATVIVTSQDGKAVNGAAALTSDNPSVAKIESNNVVEAVGAGTAVIRATIANHTGSTSVVVQAGSVATSPGAGSVLVSIDSTTLLVGHVATATATAKDGKGNPITGQPTSWTSLTPTVATVSQSGSVTAVSSGSATIQATIAGTSGTTTVSVVTQPILVSHNFNDGTIGPFHGTKTTLDFPDDPTGSGRGKVARILYAPTADNRSADDYLNFRTYDAGKLRYGATIWFKGDFYLPRNPLNDPNWRDTDFRKLLDWQGSSDDGWTGGGARFDLIRKTANSDGVTPTLGVEVYRFSADGLTGSISFYGEFGTIDFDKWYTIEVKMTTNSANGVHDGVLEFYINNATSTPTYRATGLDLINDTFAPVGPDGVPRVGSYFNDFRFGSQLSDTSPFPLNTEYRYWDNVSFSSTRIGQ